MSEEGCSLCVHVDVVKCTRAPTSVHGMKCGAASAN